jgi:hypothetical protein
MILNFFSLASFTLLCKGHFDCDVCGKAITPTDVRYHCLDCVDYDMHTLCYESGHDKTHRVRRFNVSEPNIGVGLQFLFFSLVECTCCESRIFPFITHLCTLFA